MNPQESQDPRLTEEGVREDLQRQPHLMLRLAENALIVAESLRDNYFKNSTKLIRGLRRMIYDVGQGKRQKPLLSVYDAGGLEWANSQGEVVTFIDGGIGQVQISNRVPILLRVGSYCVRVGERRLAEREQFGYYPVILGDLTGGSKERKDFPDIIRITAELLGGLSCLQRTPDLNVLMFHGPLVYNVGRYTIGGPAHTPFLERDVDLFLHQYAREGSLARSLKDEFLTQARQYLYPNMAPERCDEWIKRRLFEPLAWMSFLYRRLITEALSRRPAPLILGVVERGASNEFCRRILFPRTFQELRRIGKEGRFNEMFGRTDLTSPEALLSRLQYDDKLLLAMLMEPGQYSEPWEMSKYHNLSDGELSLPGEAFTGRVNFAALQPEVSGAGVGFPRVLACYVHVSKTTEPVRVEVFRELGDDQIVEAARRTYLYSRLLPGYGFPVGLDIADKHAHVPQWLTEAYGKLIRHHLGVSLQRGEISDSEMRRLLVQAIYMTHRDWLFRPDS